MVIINCVINIAFTWLLITCCILLLCCSITLINFIHFCSQSILPEVYNGWQQSVRTKPQCHHDQPGPPVAGPALPHASTGPFALSSAALPHPVRGTTSGSTTLPSPSPSPQTRGHKGSCKHSWVDQAQERWTCKKNFMTIDIDNCCQPEGKYKKLSWDFP